MNELALFAGAGGGILGGKLLGWRTVCAVEWDAYARDVLVARQNDGCLDPFPIWDDVQTFDGRPWRGRVDVVSGGFPCQDVSACNKDAKGIEGERSSMWKHMARIIGEVEPGVVWVENSPLLVGRGLGMVLGDLAAMGYDARWGIVGAHHAAAPHQRNRIWILANPQLQQRPEPVLNGCGTRVGREAAPERGEGASEITGRRRILADSEIEGLEGHGNRAAVAEAGPRQGYSGPASCPNVTWWEAEPGMGRVADGVACGMDRLRCLGNGQVPAVVPLAWNLLR